MHKWGMIYWETYSPVVNCMSVRELHTGSVGFVLSYTYSDVKSEIFIEPPIVFGFEGAYPREWVTRLDKNRYVLTNEGLAWFEKLKGILEAR